MEKLSIEEIKCQKHKLTTWFDNLYENKIIYHERITFLATLTNFIFDDKGFSATVTKEHIFYMPPTLRRRKNLLCHKLYSFEISSTYGSDISFEESKQKIHGTYLPFTIWSEPSFVKNIEKLIKEGQLDEANGLIK